MYYAAFMSYDLVRVVPELRESVLAFALRAPRNPAATFGGKWVWRFL